MDDDGIKKMPMELVTSKTNPGEFVADFRARVSNSRTVRFAFDQANATALYQALGAFLHAGHAGK